MIMSTRTEMRRNDVDVMQRWTPMIERGKGAQLAADHVVLPAHRFARNAFIMKCNLRPARRANARYFVVGTHALHENRTTLECPGWVRNLGLHSYEWLIEQKRLRTQNASGSRGVPVPMS